MMDIIKTLKESKNKLLEAEAEDLGVWSKLKHNKEDLELFLNHNIAEIKFLTKDGKEASVIGTANTTLITIFQLKKDAEKKKLKFVKSRGLKTNDTTSVQIWDLVDGHPKTVFLKSWVILDFISISEKNILLLDQILHDLLKK